MADNTHIEWTDATWNPITGCSVVSPGCTNCYAMKLAGTRLQHHASRAGLTKATKAGPVWTGEVRFNEQWLDQPLRWRRPRFVFVCAHGDLFAEGVPDEWIDRVFAVMALAPQHTFQVLTKRADRMRAYIDARRSAEITRAMYDLSPRHPMVDWPLPNVWLGVSAEDQPRAEARVLDLLATLAARRFVSLEPMLGGVDLRNLFARNGKGGAGRYDALTGEWRPGDLRDLATRGGPRLDWVIVGGESGAGARPMHPEWARALRDQCTAAGVAFFFKQWGAWSVGGGRAHFKETLPHPWKRVDSGQPAIRPAFMVNDGKAAAGRLLDGRTWDQRPEVRA